MFLSVLNRRNRWKRRQPNITSKLSRRRKKNQRLNNQPRLHLMMQRHTACLATRCRSISRLKLLSSSLLRRWSLRSSHSRWENQTYLRSLSMSLKECREIHLCLLWRCMITSRYVSRSGMSLALSRQKTSNAIVSHRSTSIFELVTTTLWQVSAKLTELENCRE